jgi:hypothetical protein
MTKIIISEDCGNSPKNIFVQDITIAFAKGDSKFIAGKVTDDFRWNIIGDQLIEGKDRIAEALDEIKKDSVEVLTIRHIATHGKAGAVYNDPLPVICGSTRFKATAGFITRRF